MTEIIKGARRELEKKAAEIIKNAIDDLLEEKPFINLALPGGRNVSRIFERLADKQIPWTKVNIFMVDDRLVPISNQKSNSKLVADHLTDELMAKGLLPAENFHPFIYDQAQEDFGMKDYEKELKRCGREYDIVLLSSGKDGHVASLFPHNPAVEDSSEFFVEIEDAPHPPDSRITMSRKLFLKTRVALVLFFGAEKREAFERFNDNAVDVRACPSKLVQAIEKSYALTDLK